MDMQKNKKINWRKTRLVKPIRDFYWFVRNLPRTVFAILGRVFLYIKKYIKYFLPNFLIQWWKKAYFDLFGCNKQLQFSKKRTWYIKKRREVFLKKVDAKNKRIAVYVSTQGNYFFEEIARVIVEGFNELGYEVNLYYENDVWIPNVAWHIVVAPQEFFTLGVGKNISKRSYPTNLIIIQAEQPKSKWFSSVIPFFKKAYAVWDIDFSSYETIKPYYPYVDFLQLGYSKKSDLSQFGEYMVDNVNTLTFDKQIKKTSFVNKNFNDRPIDICFIGHTNARRAAFFERHAAFFKKYNCYFFLSDPLRPVIAGENNNLDTRTTMSILQRSKILLNIHHGEEIYFEWHRIVMHGIANKNLVLTEPVTPAPPFIAGQDFITCVLDGDWEEYIRKFLDSDSGSKEAQEIIDSAHRRLVEDCRISDKLAVLMKKLLLKEVL